MPRPLRLRLPLRVEPFIGAGLVDPGVTKRITTDTILGSSEFVKHHAERVQRLAQNRSVARHQ